MKYSNRCLPLSKEFLLSKADHFYARVEIPTGSNLRRLQNFLLVISKPSPTLSTFDYADEIESFESTNLDQQKENSQAFRECKNIAFSFAGLCLYAPVPTLLIGS